MALVGRVMATATEMAKATDGEDNGNAMAVIMDGSSGWWQPQQWWSSSMVVIVDGGCLGMEG